MATGTADVKVGADVVGAVDGMKKVDDAVKRVGASAKTATSAMSSVKGELLGAAASAVALTSIISMMREGAKNAEDWSRALVNVKEEVKRIGGGKAQTQSIADFSQWMRSMTGVQDEDVAMKMSKQLAAGVSEKEAQARVIADANMEAAGLGSGFAEAIVTGDAGRLRGIVQTAAQRGIDTTGMGLNQAVQKIAGSVQGRAAKVFKESPVAQFGVAKEDAWEMLGGGLANGLQGVRRGLGGIGLLKDEAVAMGQYSDWALPTASDRMIKEDKDAGSNAKLLPSQASTADIKVSVAHGAADRVSVTGATR